jgi:hypothetical protein
MIINVRTCMMSTSSYNAETGFYDPKFYQDAR